jgi:phage terminase small subunit
MAETSDLSAFEQLPAKRRKFALAYVANNFNATRAAIEAGYAEKSAYSQGQRMLKNVEVKAAIDEIVEEDLRQLGINGACVIKELAKIGFSDMRNFAEWNENGVRFKGSDEIDDKAAPAVAEVRHFKTVKTFGKGEDMMTIEEITVSMKLHSKTAALETLAKHTGAVKDKVHAEISTKDDEPLPVKMIVLDV